MSVPALTAAPLDLDGGLRRLGYDSFRPGQRAAIETLLDRGRLLLVAPTGGGKSLIYQLPATILGGTTLVISPLVALMNDQVQALAARGVSATFLASTLTTAEVRSRMARMAAGEYALAYVAPERLVFPGFRGLLRDMRPPLVAIDEAHCISEWGHDFRPEYMQIGELIEDLRPPRVLACTATATPIVRDEILSRLGLGPDTPQLVQGFARPNLALRAAEAASERDRDARVDALLGEALGAPGQGRGTAIVYAPTRRSTEEQSSRLSGNGWRTAPYHAGMDGPAREKTQAGFAAGQVEVVVATNAFGMGIDRADVRAVVHLAPPGSIEAYYQEVGRAGRDGAPAFGLLLVSAQDVPLRRRLIESGSDGQRPSDAVIEHKWGLFLELMRWSEGGSCRHDAILRYFDDEGETLSGCGRCDVCASLDAVPEVAPEETTLVVRKALSAVARVHRRFGLTAAVKLLAGKSDPRLESAGLQATTTFGTLAGESEDWLTRVVRRCVTAGWVDFTTGERPLVLLTESGRAVMKAERPARLVLPSRHRVAPVRSSGTSSRRHSPQPGGVDALDAAASALFEALRKHRMALAREQGVPPYVVASDRALREIALIRPRTLGDLTLAHGIGAAKAERYGRGLLEVVARAGPR